MIVGTTQFNDRIRSRKVIVDTRPSRRCEHVHVAGFDEIHLLVGDETLDNLGSLDTDVSAEARRPLRILLSAAHEGHRCR